MLGFLILSLSLVSAFATESGETATTYAFAADISTSVSSSHFTCLRSSGFQTVFLRAYNPSGSGSFDSNFPANFNYAYAAGLGTEAFMVPSPLSKKTASNQIDDIFNGLHAKSINLKKIWIQVTEALTWSPVFLTNIQFINAAVTRAQQYGWAVGIYTNFYDWNQIVAGYSSFPSNISVWYWHTYATGLAGETSADFTDFRPFGNWNQATVKQFAQGETLCSININRNVYPTSFSILSDEERKVVGHIGLKEKN